MSGNLWCPCKQNLKWNSWVITRDPYENFRMFLEHFLQIFLSHIPLNFFFFEQGKTRKIHVVILLVEFLVICTSRTQEIHMTIEHVTRNFHYSWESPVSILCIHLVLFPMKYTSYVWRDPTPLWFPHLSLSCGLQVSGQRPICCVVTVWVGRPMVRSSRGLMSSQPVTTSCTYGYGPPLPVMGLKDLNSITKLLRNVSTYFLSIYHYWTPVGYYSSRQCVRFIEMALHHPIYIRHSYFDYIQCIFV